MFFYISLFVACVISALLVLYVYNALADVGKAVYKSILPSRKDHLTRNIRNVRFNSKVNETPTPWGWKGGDHGAREPVAKGSTMNAANGLDAFVNKHGNESTSVGWPYREEKNEFAGKAYKVTRRTSPKKSNLQTSGNQPWGW
jgi:hypothetical protein